MTPVARKGYDTIHFTRTDTGLTLCGHPCTGSHWETLANHEVEDAQEACICRACKRTTAWNILLRDDLAAAAGEKGV